MAEIALVTGGSRGIGRHLVADLVGRGWQVAALARDGDALATVARQAPAGRVLPVVADVTDPAAVQRAVAAVQARWGVPDLVLANAGVLTAVGPTWQADPDDWWRDMTVNVRGVHLTLWAVLPAMLARGSGRIVVVSSGMGGKPSPHSSAYGASKAAVTHLVGSLSAELDGSGVRVFAISPGMVRTDMTRWPETLLAHRPDLAEAPDSAYLPASAAADLVADLASGRLDALAGRFLHVRDDREALLASCAP